MDEVLFTPSSLLDLLSQIDELKDVNIGIVESPDGSIKLKVGESTYNIDTSNATEIPVEEEVIEDIQDVNEEMYSEMGTSSEIEVDTDPETVESGIVKELLKTLLIGGVVRMTAKALKN